MKILHNKQDLMFFMLPKIFKSFSDLRFEPFHFSRLAVYNYYFLQWELAFLLKICSMSGLHRYFNKCVVFVFVTGHFSLSIFFKEKSLEQYGILLSRHFLKKVLMKSFCFHFHHFAYSFPLL